MSVRLYLLAAGTFVVGTTAYVITSLLPAISAELGVSTSTAGQLSTAFALTYAIGAPLVATLTGRWDRRRMLTASLFLAALGNLVSALAPNFTLVLIGRVLAALGAAGVTPTATVIGTGLLPAQQRGRAVAVVFAGLTVAMALGVPLGGFLGPVLGFRGVYGLLAAVAVLIAILSAIKLPSVPAPPPVDLRTRLGVALNRRALTMLGLTVVAMVSAMSVYFYLVPLLDVTAGVGGAVVSGLLLIYGIGAIIGNAVGGRVTDRYGARPTLLVILTVSTLLLITLPVTASTVFGAAVALLVWGLFTWSFNPPVQSLLIQVGAERAALLISLNASAIYLGAGIAGGLGGVLIDTGGPLILPYVSAGLGVVAVALVLSLARIRERAGARI